MVDEINAPTLSSTLFQTFDVIPRAFMFVWHAIPFVEPEIATKKPH